MGRSDGLGTAETAIQPETEGFKRRGQQQPVEFIPAPSDEQGHGFQVGVAFLDLGKQPGSASHSLLRY